MKEYKSILKFFAKICLVLAVSLLLIFIANLFYVKYGIWRDEESCRFYNIPDKIDVCNFGNSHAYYGFLYEQYPDNGFNFAQTGQLFGVDKIVLDNYIDRLSDGAIVFINVSYISMLNEVDRSTDINKPEGVRYYRILPKKDIPDYSLFTDICYHWCPVLTSYDYFLDTIYDFVRGKGPERPVSYLDDSKFADAAYKTYEKHYERRKENDGSIMWCEEKIDSLENIVEALRGKNVNIFLITLPTSREYLDCFEEYSDGYLSRFDEKVREIAEKYGIEYLDYGTDARICDNHRYFRDADHMNQDGATAFMNILKDEVIDAYLSK